MGTQNKLTLTIISIYQIFGALLGLYVLAEAILNNDLLTNIKLAFLIFPIFLYSFISSVALFINLNDPRKILIYTYINQWIQVIQFKYNGFGLYVILGSYFHFGYINNDVAQFFFDYGLFTANANVSITSELTGEMFLINVVPVVIILLLNFISKRSNTIQLD